MLDRGEAARAESKGPLAIRIDDALDQNIGATVGAAQTGSLTTGAHASTTSSLGESIEDRLQLGDVGLGLDDGAEESLVEHRLATIPETDPSVHYLFKSKGASPIRGHGFYVSNRIDASNNRHRRPFPKGSGVPVGAYANDALTHMPVAHAMMPFRSHFPSLRAPARSNRTTTRASNKIQMANK